MTNASAVIKFEAEKSRNKMLAASSAAYGIEREVIPTVKTTYQITLPVDTRIDKPLDPSRERKWPT